MNPPDDAALLETRRVLHDEQRRAAAGAKLPEHPEPDLTNATLRALEAKTHLTPTDDPQLARRGLFKFHPNVERARIERAGAIVRRVRPGPFEDPERLAMLAYQAASIEPVYERLRQSAGDSRLFSSHVLGTVPFHSVNAFAHVSHVGDYVVVFVHSMLMDFFHQVVTTFVEATRPVRSENPGHSVSLRPLDRTTIEAALASDPAPLDRLYRFMEAYFFEDAIPTRGFEHVSEGSPVLSSTLSMALRFAVAHEYGHGLAPPVRRAPDSVNASVAEEFLADAHATVLTVWSANEYDGTAPEITLGGIIYALASLDLLERAKSVLLTGQEKSPNLHDDSYPPPKERAMGVLRTFRQYFDVVYTPGGWDLTFVMREASPRNHNFGSDHSDRAFAPANALLALWKHLKVRLMEDYKNRRALRPVLYA